ncbi:MAG: GAF domain-containing protein [Oscillospiraceae bacterium]|nr:GAF domain-containing protein [Oscillospiraceae bacterium]
MTDYRILSEQMQALLEGIPHPIANLANASALLWQSLPDLNWAGFYLLEGDKLVLGPFQGKTACIEIPLGRGVCGTAAAENRTLLVSDVHCFQGHIACDSASNSEIVIPLHRDGRVAAVLDLDSPSKNRFTEADRIGLEAVAAVLERQCIFPALT